MGFWGMRPGSCGGALLLLAASACAHETAPDPPPEGSLGGTEQSVVLSGDPGAPEWPAALQELLDLHAGGRIYHVLDRAVDGAPLTAWIAPVGSDDYQRTVGSLASLVGTDGQSRRKAPIVRTLVWLPPRLTAGKKAPVTFEALEVVALRLRGLGFERVLIGRPPGPEGEPYDRLGRLGHPFVVVGPELPAPPAGQDRGVEAGRLLARRTYRLLVGAAAGDEPTAADPAEETTATVD